MYQLRAPELAKATELCSAYPVQQVWQAAARV